MPLSTFLNAGTVTQLRGLAWLSLSDVGQIGAGTATSDSGGGGSITWSYSGTIACRIDPLTGNEVQAADRIADRSQYLISVPPGTQITTSNRFAIAGRGTFEVTAVHIQTGELSARFFEAVPLA